MASKRAKAPERIFLEFNERGSLLNWEMVRLVEDAYEYRLVKPTKKLRGRRK